MVGTALLLLLKVTFVRLYAVVNHSFSLLCSRQLCEYTKLWSFLPFIIMWIAFRVWLLWVTVIWISGTCLLGNMCIYFVGHIGYAYILLQERVTFYQSGYFTFQQQDVRVQLLQILSNTGILHPSLLAILLCIQGYFNLNVLKISGTKNLFFQTICHIIYYLSF